jgi:hypothetical protein
MMNWDRTGSDIGAAAFNQTLADGSFQSRMNCVRIRAWLDDEAALNGVRADLTKLIGGHFGLML